jgi:PAS domain S-box-containing protein
MTTADRQPMPAAGNWGAGPKPPTFAVRMDEAAATIHEVAAVKVVLTLMGGAMGALILPLNVCVIWVAGSLVLETWCWFATRAQARGEAVDWRTRASFIGYHAVANLWWLLMGALFWGAGTLAGQVTGGVMVLAVALVCVLLFHNAPWVFLAAGAAPAIWALTMVALDDGHDWREMMPVWLALGLSIIFNLGRALDTPSAQVSQRRLNDSLNKFTILAENVTDLIARTDLNGTYQYVSPASLAVLGYTPEELLGTSLADLVHPASGGTMLDGLERMLANPDGAEVVTARARRKDGRWVWLQTSVKLVREDGVPVGVIGVSRDVTERVRADEALQAAKAEAECANRAKAEFLANVSHEIRTPMNAVLGALHLLEREPLSSEGHVLIRQASDCGRMLSQLLNDVLDFSKIEAGKMELAPNPWTWPKLCAASPPCWAAKPAPRASSCAARSPTATPGSRPIRCVCARRCSTW